MSVSPQATPVQAAQPLLAAGAMVLAMALIGFIDNFVAPMSESVGLWQFLILRLVLMLPMFLALAWLGYGSVRPKRFWAVSLRAVFAVVAMLIYFASLGFMPVAEALAGLFTAPIFILLITAFVLRQRVGPWRVGAVLAGFVGIMLVLQLTTRPVTILALLPLLAGLFYGISSMMTRRICSGEPVLAMVLWVFTGQALMSGAALAAITLAGWTDASSFILRGWVWPLPWDAFLIILLQAVGSIAGLGLNTFAYTRADASYVTVFEYSVFIFGPLFSYLIFGAVLALPQVLGIALIAASGIVIALRTRHT